MDEIIIAYEEILSGVKKKFSPFAFQQEFRKKNLTAIIQCAVTKMGFTPEEALEKMDFDLACKYRLDLLFELIPKPIDNLDKDVSYLLYYAYPELTPPSNEEMTLKVYNQLLNQTRKTFPKGFFTDGQYGEERALICFRHICEQLENISTSQLNTMNTSTLLKLLAKYKLKIIMNVVYFSVYELIEKAYPNIYSKGEN